VSGGAGDDTIIGLLGTSGTYSVGDNINGGSGTDTLNLIAASSTDGAAGLVSLDGVEVVNIRQLGTAAQALTVNAADWSGVAKLSNASSLGGSLLQVSGTTAGMTFEVYGDTDLNVDFAGLTTATDTAKVTLVAAGSGSAATALSYSDVNLDLDGSGLLDAATLTLSGNSYVNVKGGDDLRTITVNGSANYLVLKTTATEVITSIDASALNGTNNFFLSGRNDIAVVGGGGNDTFTFGTSLNASDSINGGNGTDTISATLGNSVVRLQATAVEAASLTLGEAAGGGLDLSAAQSVTTLTVGATAGASGSITSFVGGTVNLADDDITDFSIDTIASATLTVNVGTATGSVAIATATITDASTLVIVSNGGTGSNSITTLSVDGTDTKSVSVLAENDADLTITDFDVSGATAVTLTTNGSGSITITDADIGSAISVFTINAGGGNAGDISMMGSATGASAVLLFDASSALPDTITINANSGADVTIGTEIQLGTAAASGAIQTVVMTLNAAGNGSIIANSATSRAESLGAGIDLNIDVGSATVNLIAGASGTIQVGTADMGDLSSVGTGTTGNVSLNISASVAQDGLVSIGSISADDAPINIGAITVGSSGGLVIGSAAAGITMTTATASFGTITLGTMATATIGAVALAGSGGKVTGLSFVGATAAGVTVGTLGGSGVGAITLNLGQSATATFADITATTVGNINVTLAEQATATFDDLEVTGAAATIGTITVSVASGAEFTMGSAGSAGAAAGFGSIAGYNITVANSASADFGVIATTGAGRVGDIIINVSGGGDVDFGTIAASAVGTIQVSGSGSITFSTVTATTLAGVDLRNQGSGGDFTINLSGVTNGVIVDGGRGTSTITAGDGVDEYYLKTGLGSDNLVFSTTGQAADIVYRFEAGTADDQIRIAGSAGIVISDGSGDVLATTNGTAASVVILSSTAAAATAMIADANLLIITHTAFASKTDMVSAIASGGSHTVGLIAGASSDAAGNLAVVWTDGTDSYVTLVSIGTDSTAIDDDSYSADTLLTISNVTAGALVAANFAFV